MKSNRLAKLLGVRAASKLRNAARRRKNIGSSSTITSPPPSRASSPTSPRTPTPPAPGSPISPLENTPGAMLMLDTIHAQLDGLHNATDGGPDGPQGADGRPSGANQTAVLQEYYPDDRLYRSGKMQAPKFRSATRTRNPTTRFLATKTGPYK
jgi:hypothetical protein